MKVFPIILAGGQGSRFWPLSREKHPKQFLSISPSGETLIQATARRAEKAFPYHNPTVVTNQLHQYLVETNLPNASIIIEPIARNTAAAIGLAAVSVMLEEPEGVMLVLPSDHHIKDLSRLFKAWGTAASLAFHENKLVTVGISPESPHTGYGYIKRGLPIPGYADSFELERFYEKPNLERATQYCNSGDYSWNAGMFVWKASTILQEIKQFMPKLHQALLNIEVELRTTKDPHQILGRISKEFTPLESISIDFGVLEHSKNCAVVRANDIGWSDVGSWDVWAEHFPKDTALNTVQGDGLILDSSGCMIKVDKFFAVLGVKDLIVVDTPDGLLICNKNNSQDVKKVVEFLKRAGKNELV